MTTSLETREEVLAKSTGPHQLTTETLCAVDDCISCHVKDYDYSVNLLQKQALYTTS